MANLNLKYKISIPNILIRIYTPEIKNIIPHTQTYQYRLPLRRKKNQFQLNLFNI
jgi:hypothetical protein